MIAAFLVIGGFLYWLNLQAAEQEAAQMVEEDTPVETATIEGAVVVAPADIEVDATPFEGQMITLEGLPVASQLGAQGFWLEMPNGNPFLVAGDIMSMFNDRPEVQALMEYFTVPQSASIWLANGSALAAHQTTPLEMYSEDLRGVADCFVDLLRQQEAACVGSCDPGCGDDADPVGIVDCEPEGVWGTQVVESSPPRRPRHRPRPDSPVDGAARYLWRVSQP